jgi:Outer membrane lipoprotein-sorting protein
MSKFLKFYLIIILLSCSALADIKEENATKTLNTWKQETKFYIDNFYNLTGTFTQIDYVGNISKGNFWINNKKEIAFHYNPPYETVIIYKSGKLFFKERKSESFQNYSINNNPILELLENNSNINKYLNSSIIDGNIGKITINVNEGNERNSLEVVFDYPKPVLRQWKYIDHQKKETNIFFSKLNL